MRGYLNCVHTSFIGMYVEYHTINYTEAQEARLKATAMAEEWKQGIIMV